MRRYFALERAISRSAVADRGEGPGCVGGLRPPPLFLDQTKAQRAKKNSALSPAPYSESLGGFWFWDENERKRGFSQAWTSVILAGKRDSRHSTTSFSDRCRRGGNKLSVRRSFIILLSGEGLTSFRIHNRSNFFGVKM